MIIKILIGLTNVIAKIEMVVYSLLPCMIVILVDPLGAILMIQSYFVLLYVLFACHFCMLDISVCYAF